MKKSSFVAALAFTSVAASSAWAQNGRPADPLYIGVKAGTVEVDESGFDDASNAGVFVGYKLHEDQDGTFFAEGEYSRTFNDGDVGAGEWDIETLAAYGGYRTAGPWFLKAKAGFAWRDVNIIGLAPGVGVDGSETSLSFGAGGGFRMNQDTGLELEYTYLDSDVSSLMFGIFTRF